jgi:hypothetical protein
MLQAEQFNQRAIILMTVAPEVWGEEQVDPDDVIVPLVFHVTLFVVICR